MAVGCQGAGNGVPYTTHTPIVMLFSFTAIKPQLNIYHNQCWDEFCSLWERLSPFTGVHKSQLVGEVKLECKYPMTSQCKSLKKNLLVHPGKI